MCYLLVPEDSDWVDLDLKLFSQLMHLLIFVLPLVNSKPTESIRLSYQNKILIEVWLIRLKSKLIKKAETLLSMSILNDSEPCCHFSNYH